MVRNKRIKRIFIQGDENHCNFGVLICGKEICHNGMAELLGVPFPLPTALLFGPCGNDVHEAKVPRSDPFIKIFALVSSGQSG